jgi:hypothetical protein
MTTAQDGGEVVSLTHWTTENKKFKVKQARYRPGVAQMVPGI